MDPIFLLPLNGLWRFTPENGTAKDITVPGGGWLKQGFDCEAGWYETNIEIPDICQNQTVLLKMESVNHLARVFVNDTQVHEEVTAFTPQTADLTPYVSSGETVRLRIFVRAFENGRPIAPHWAEWCPYIARGIFRGVYLLVYPALYISDIFVKPSVKTKTLSYELTIKNSGTLPAQTEIRANFGFLDIPAVVPANGGITVNSEPVCWALGEDSYWRPNLPYRKGYKATLHKFQASLGTGHTASVRFGFRECRQEGEHYTLNGIPIRFRGDNLQAADYDCIDYGGYGDAIDTYPGFLPPSKDNPGWPGAVDNFLRFNNNIQREHMGPWTPYMIDVCDEMGLMLIGESACRWNGFDMENGRGFYEEKHLADVIRRDRNHPSIIRWCLKNEAQCLEPGYHVSLYNAAKKYDDTRPLHEDYLVGDRKTNVPEDVFAPLLTKSDFTWIEHYLTAGKNGEPFFSTSELNDVCVPLINRPYGIGEADWMRSFTPAGFTWFSSTMALLRAQKASDIRIYSLLSSWCGVIPGTKTTDFIGEEKKRPVLGEDNLEDPWGHDGIRLFKNTCSPLFAMDHEFWKLNAGGDAYGHFPVRAAELTANECHSREITVFNDDLFGENIVFRWSIHDHSLSNKPLFSGEELLHITPANSGTVKINFRAPDFNCYLFLKLELQKDNQTRYFDEYTMYKIIGGKDYSPDTDGEQRVFL
jgi:hypothetical protein